MYAQKKKDPQDEEGAWYLRWDALAESGEHFAQGLRERLGGRGAVGDSWGLSGIVVFLSKTKKQKPVFCYCGTL